MNEATQIATARSRGRPTGSRDKVTRHKGGRYEGLAAVMRVAERVGFKLGDLQVDQGGAMTVVLKLGGAKAPAAEAAVGDA
ncbi:MAG TPA: hypothetical protein VHT00_14020 [Stellaceae bacterium]|jgi:hypothetical protein|nr:hypothetical protein [Stellaceae bacterium]